MKQWAQHINLNPYKTQRSQNTIQFASQKVSNSTINAKCPNLKHKSRLVHVQNTSTKTRSKTKPNDQNRSQSFTYCTFKQLRKCPQKDQHQFTRQVAQMINVKQRQANEHKMDNQIRKFKSKQKCIQWLWNVLYKLLMLWTNIMQKIKSRRAQMIGEQKCTNAVQKMWHKLSHYIFMCQKQW